MKCSCSRAVGSSFERWSSLLPGDAFLVTCSGDHFSMIEKNRGQDIGNVLATTASLIFRNISPMTGGIKLNANHDLGKDICKNHGIKIFMIRKSGSTSRTVDFPAIVALKSLNQFTMHNTEFANCVDIQSTS